MTQLIDITKVSNVYSGKNHKCCCGCAGIYRYAATHVEQGGKARGYAVDPSEVNDSFVRRVVKRLNENPDQVEVLSDNQFTLEVNDHLYMVMYAGA